MTIEQQNQIRFLRQNGEGYKRIASLLGLSVNTVKSFCRRNDNLVGEAEETASSVGTAVSCRQCGESVQQIAGRRPRIFCCNACKTAYWRSRAKPLGQHRLCPGCGMPLLGHDQSRKYCCHACYITHRFGGEAHA